jgi:hypothetical protein
MKVLLAKEKRATSGLKVEVKELSETLRSDIKKIQELTH